MKHQLALLTPPLLIALVHFLTVVAPTKADPPGTIDKRLAPHFRPPEELKNDFGSYKSPLKFNDGRPVKNAEDWQLRRKEIRKKWDDLLGTWPPLVEKPKIEYLEKERRGNVTQHHVRIQRTPDRFTDDAYLLVPDGEGPFPAVLVVFYEAKTGIGLGKYTHIDYALQMAKRGFVTLSVGADPFKYYPDQENASPQPLSAKAYFAANCCNLLASLAMVNPLRIGMIGHSYGGKWTMFATCLYERFAFAVWGDPGVVFDESNRNVNYWEPWYIGFEPGKKQRNRGVPNAESPRTGPYKKLKDAGDDLNDLHALMRPRPFLVSGGSEDPPKNWRALNHTVAVNKLLGYENRVGMTSRPNHTPTDEANEVVYLFFEHFGKKK